MSHTHSLCGPNTDYIDAEKRGPVLHNGSQRSTTVQRASCVCPQQTRKGDQNEKWTKTFWTCTSTNALCRAAINGCQPIECAATSLKLNKINLPTEIAHARAEVSRRRGAGRDDAIRRLGYLTGAEKNGLHPKDWMLDKVPVLPPIFRQVGLLGNTKIPLVPDANLLYRELLSARDNLTSLSPHVDDVGDERLALYKSFKAVVGLGDPLSKKLQEKQVSGILTKLLGSSPKMGTVQRRLLSQSVDMVGRAVISPNADLHMDSVEIPEARAKEVYNNFIVRRLVRRGMPVSEAMRQAKEYTPLAKQEMLNEMKERPVIVSRAPVLHRFGILAMWPKLTKDASMHMSPLACTSLK